MPLDISYAIQLIDDGQKLAEIKRQDNSISSSNSLQMELAFQIFKERVARGIFSQSRNHQPLVIADVGGAVDGVTGQ
jgi:hypothetical protein